jgi:phosphoesterase RecJ-like protein
MPHKSWLDKKAIKKIYIDTASSFFHKLRQAMNDPYLQIQETVAANESFAILSHIRPDGDAYGSALGLALCLEAMGKSARVFFQDGMNETYRFLPHSNKIEITPLQPLSDKTVIITVDTSTFDRIGANFRLWDRIPDINIDHHISNTQFAKINLIDPQSPATAQVIFEMIQRLSWPLDAATASNLFVGIITDTGSFRFRQTTGRTFAVAAALTEAGACPSKLAERCFHANPMAKFKLQQEVLSQAQFYFNNKVVCCRITPDMIARHKALPEHTENILEPIQSVKDVEVAFVIESGYDRFQRVSLRSRGKVDVSAIAIQLGGGGHAEAAGLRTELPTEQLQDTLLAALAPYFSNEG